MLARRVWGADWQVARRGVVGWGTGLLGLGGRGCGYVSGGLDDEEKKREGLYRRTLRDTEWGSFIPSEG